MDIDETETVTRILKERGIDAQRALVVLVQAMVDQHCDRTERGDADTVIGDDGFETWTGGDALVAVMRFLNIDSNDNWQTYEAQDKLEPEESSTVSGQYFFEDLSCGEKGGVQDTLMEILQECWEKADEQMEASRENDEEDDTPPMRLAG